MSALRLVAPGVAAIAALAVACAAVGQVTRVAGKATGHEELVSAGESLERSAREFTEEEKYWIGRTVAAQLLTTRRASQRLELERYVGRAGQTVALASSKPQLAHGWHFVLVEGQSPEAFSCPGGTVLVGEGLVRLCRSEDELAAVLAHEAAHVALDHPMTAISAANRKAAAVSLAQFGVSQATRQSELANLKGVFDSVIREVGQAVAKGYDRGKEAEADRTAIQILAEAGYDPRALAAVLGRLAAGGAAHGDPKIRAAEVLAVVRTLGTLPALAPERTARFDRAIR